MITHEIFTNVEPSFEKVLLFKKKDAVNFNALLQLLEKYRKEIIENFYTFSESDNYLFCQRAINLIGWHKYSDAFSIVFEILENLDEEDEILSSECSLCLQEIVKKSHGPFLWEKWKKHSESKDLFKFGIFELLIFSGYENDEVINAMIKILSDRPDLHWLKDVMATNSNNERVQIAVKNQLHFIAPMVKYIKAPLEYHDYLREWNDLGAAFIERKYKLPKSEVEFSENSDEKFIIDILGHNDDRASEMLMARFERLSDSAEKIKNNTEEINKLLKTEFLDSLPHDAEDWLELETVSQNHKREFIDELELIHLTMNPQIKPRKLLKVGRNDPCPCGSGKKYKKCCSPS